MRRPALACLLAVALAVAGCSGGTTQFGGGSGPTPTATPAPVPSPSPTPTPSALPAGLYRGGIGDAWVLTTGHNERLENRSHTLRVDQATRYPNGTVRWRRSRVARVDGDRSHVVVDQAGRPALHEFAHPRADRVELYVEDGWSHAAVTRNGATEYRRFRRTPDHRRDLFMLLSAVETRVSWKDHRNGTTVFRVDATGAPSTNRFRYVEEVRNARDVTLWLLVDDRGVIRARHLSYTTTVDGQRVRYERTVRVTAIGETTVERPPWTDRVRPTDDGSTSGDRGAPATGRGATAP